MGHSALRTYVMGERAFTEKANDDELKRMCHEVQEAVRAGAIGFSTSRTRNHITADDRPVASRIADWDEVRALVNAMGDVGAGEPAGEHHAKQHQRDDASGVQQYLHGREEVGVAQQLAPGGVVALLHLRDGVGAGLPQHRSSRRRCMGCKGRPGGGTRCNGASRG